MKNILLLISMTLLYCSLAAQETVTFEFSNPTIIGTAPNSQLRFNVNLKASAAGTFHSNGQVYFSYNTAAFGASILANGKITVQKLDLLNGLLGIDEKYEVLLNDNSPGIFALTWVSGFASGSPGTLFLNEVATTYLPLAQITIDIADANELAGINFVENLMNGQQFFRQASNDDQQYVIPNGYENNLNAQILPAELHFFGLMTDQHSIHLNWETSHENALKGYELERSTNGRIFQKIAFVDSKNQVAIHQYHYEDKAVDHNVKYYYRLKILDLDGSFEYSEIKNATIVKKENKLVLYPNPAKDNVTISGNENDLVGLKLYNNEGKVILEETNFRRLSTTKYELDISNLPIGMYFIQTQTGSVKLVKH